MTTPSSISVHEQIWRVLALFEHAPTAPVSGHRLDELAQAFDELATGHSNTRGAAEESIWRIWCDHPEASARDSMASGIRQLSAGNLTAAETVFDGLVQSHSNWAEVWNKRATLYFLQNRDALSVSDIFNVLDLEPRHFGALGGFAQICARNGAADAAHQALRRLLVLNPGAPGIAQAAAALKSADTQLLH